jgi:malonyl-CoA/methylmalonyl-CoA synthetase
MNLLGPGGYEFTVGFLAIMALGAVIVPISLDLPVKEAVYFATKSRSVGVVHAAKCTKLARDLQSAMTAESRLGFECIQITDHIMRPLLPLEELIVSSDEYLDLNKSGLVIFTSGTTGPPKGGVKRRGFFCDVAYIFQDQYDMSEGDVVLHILPVHHATGVTLTLLPFLQAGGTIEFRSGGFNVEWTWERISQNQGGKGRLDFFSGVPTIYMRLMAYFEQNISKLPPQQQQKYIQGAKNIKRMLCGTSALPRPLAEKWSKLRDGQHILTRYGGTEFGNAYSMTPWLRNVPDGSVGTKLAGIDMKIAGGADEGEVLMKSPIMFSKYLYDGEATKKALDAEGYFKTGDIARREGEFYFIMGRESVDIIKSGGYKISALDIEREILGLDYVAEVMVVGVDDEEFGQRVAAAIVLKPDFQKEGLTLSKLRGDLRGVLAGYKMPTVLRVVEDLKKNATGKVIKKVLVKEYFPNSGVGVKAVERWGGKKDSKL